jgi:hypothetical protein
VFFLIKIAQRWTPVFPIAEESGNPPNFLRRPTGCHLVFRTGGGAVAASELFLGIGHPPGMVNRPLAKALKI